MKTKYLIFILPLFFHSCYTVVDQTKLISSSQQHTPVFPSNAIIDKRLNGSWVNPVKVMDYGIQRRKLEMFYDGSFIYKPNSERNNDEYYYGEYRSIADTMILKFEIINHIEKMVFKVRNDTLYISSFGPKEYVRNNLIHTCSDCIKSWHKEK